MSSTATCSNSCATGRSPFFRACPIAESYSSELPIAFSKIDGFEVTPFTPSLSISFFRSPPTTKPRARKSSQTDWPCSSSALTGFMTPLFCLSGSLRVPVASTWKPNDVTRSRYPEDICVSPPITPLTTFRSTERLFAGFQADVVSTRRDHAPTWVLRAFTLARRSCGPASAIRTVALASAEAGVDLVECGRTGAKFAGLKRIERRIHRIEVAVQVVCVRIYVEQPGYNLSLGRVPLQERHRREPVVSVVVRIDLAERKPGAVMLFDHLHRSGRVIDRDRVTPGNYVQPVHRIVVLAHVVETLGRTGVIVECDARADDVDEGGALVLDGGGDQGHNWRLVA